MKATLTVEMDNAAFEYQGGQELARILRKLADQVEDWPGASEFNLGVRDINGNRVGDLKVTGKRG